MKINWSVLFIENNADVTILFHLIVTPFSYKIAVYKFNLKHVFEICINKYLECKISLNKQIAVENGFPPKYINQLVDQAKEASQNEQI